jgi:hypothetical protein
MILEQAGTSDPNVRFCTHYCKRHVSICQNHAVDRTPSAKRKGMNIIQSQSIWKALRDQFQVELGQAPADTRHPGVTSDISPVFVKGKVAG